MGKLEELLKAGYDVAFNWHENGLNVTVTKNGRRSMHMFTEVEVYLLRDFDNALQTTLEQLEGSFEKREV